MDAMLSRDDSSYGARYMRLAGRNVFWLPQMHHDDGAIKKNITKVLSMMLSMTRGFISMVGIISGVTIHEVEGSIKHLKPWQKISKEFIKKERQNGQISLSC